MCYFNESFEIKQTQKVFSYVQTKNPNFHQFTLVCNVQPIKIKNQQPEYFVSTLSRAFKVKCYQGNWGE